MSWQASAWVADFSESRLGSRLVMMVIGHNYINGKGTHVSLHTIAREARLSRSQAIECIKALCQTGELVIEKGRGRGNFHQYRLPLFDAAHAEIEKVRNPDLSTELKGPISVVKGPISPSKRSDLGPQEKDIKKERRKNLFVPPTTGQVFECMTLRGVVDAQYQAEQFVAHHANRGWKLGGGRGPLMKDWQMAVVTWQGNINKFTPSGGNGNGQRESFDEQRRRKAKEAIRAVGEGFEAMVHEVDRRLPYSRSDADANPELHRSLGRPVTGGT